MPARILVVEDNAQHRLLMTDILQALGYEVLEAQDGVEAIALAHREMPDLIVMDMQMPVMDGLTAARALKGDPATNGIRILAVTSFAMKGDRERILAAGVDDYMAKPIDTRQLPGLIRRLLGGGTEGQG